MPPALIEYGWLWLLCSFQGPPRGHARKPAARWPTAGARPVSQNSTACTGSSSAVCLAGPARFGRRARPIGRSRVAHAQGTSPRRRRTARFRSGTSLVLPRKEVIQPHLPVRLPCYDFTPVTSPTFDGSLPQGVRPPASGVACFHGVTGGVYKARERIHRGNADPRLLATPPSWRRVAASNPNRDRLFGIRSTSRYCSPLYRPM